MNQAACPLFNRFGIRQGLFPRFSFLEATSVGIYRPGRARRASAAALSLYESLASKRCSTRQR
jgi:hypothetical protein